MFRQLFTGVCAEAEAPRTSLGGGAEGSGKMGGELSSLENDLLVGQKLGGIVDRAPGPLGFRVRKRAHAIAGAEAWDQTAASVRDNRL